MNTILFGDDHFHALKPLTLTRPIAELRCGFLTLKQKWDKALQTNSYYITQDYLSEKYIINIESENLLINSTFLYSPTLLKLVKSLSLNEAILIKDEMIAARVSDDVLNSIHGDQSGFSNLLTTEYAESDHGPILRISSLADIIRHNTSQIVEDYYLVTKGRTSQNLSSTNVCIGKHPIFLEEGAKVECCIFNTEDGPIYIGKNSHVMEGSILRGPIGIGEDNIVKMGAKLYQGTATGPGCRLGGEVKNSVFIANSNKGHDGFVGDSAIGEWCNLGADTNTSNLKNNYQEVKLWSYESNRFEKTGLQFCGLIMGDHSKCGINTMFNTGTVVGVACNIFGDGYPRNFIPSFSWGGAAGYTEHQLNKAIETAQIVMKRRNQTLSEEDIKILEYVQSIDK
jgi:UDP-N-acetylglucosamine diphosphorylase/glucosamine-1-phosphate N-acetyltransferase